MYDNNRGDGLEYLGKLTTRYVYQSVYFHSVFCSISLYVEVLSLVTSSYTIFDGQSGYP